MTILGWFAFLTAILDAETKLITAVTASQDAATQKELWMRYIDHTKWIHLALSRFDGHMEALINKLDPAPPTQPS